VLISMTSSSSSKTDFIYIPLCVFDIGVFTGFSLREGHTSLPLVNSPLRVTRCPYLSNKIGFMTFGVRMNFLCQFCFGGFLVTFSPETPVCPHRRLRSLLGTKGPETPVSADRRLRSGLCSLSGVAPVVGPVLGRSLLRDSGPFFFERFSVRRLRSVSVRRLRSDRRLRSTQTGDSGVSESATALFGGGV
jgi:hypothetical protein